MLCEINPLIVTPEGEVRALDSKFTVDDNALYKHPDIAEMRDLEAYPPEERAAREKDVTYVKLDGEVGILGNGAGLVMSTLDVIALAGGRPANFCDLGGGGDAQGVVDALEMISADPAGALDPLQHLRRASRAATRSRAGSCRRSRRSRSTTRSSSASTARTPRRAGRSWPKRRRRTCTSSRRCSTRQSVPWSWRRERPGRTGAQAYRESETHRDGADLDLLVEWCEPGEGVKALDVATGGGHVARSAARGGLRGRDARPVARHAGRRARARRGAPLRGRRLRRRRHAHRAAPLRGRRARPWPRWRASQPAGRRRGHALLERAARGGREAARPDARAQLHRGRVARVPDRRGPRGRAGRVLREGAPARGLARAHRLRGRGGRARPRAARRPHERRRRAWVDTKIVIRARKSQS